MDEEEIGQLTTRRAADISAALKPLVLVGFFLVGWCLYKRLKR